MSSTSALVGTKKSMSNREGHALVGTRCVECLANDLQQRKHDLRYRDDILAIYDSEYAAP